MSSENEIPIPQKAPYVVAEEPGKKAWCICGRSDAQPYCDGSHAGTGLAQRAVLRWKPFAAALSSMATAKIGILTVSDRASRGEYEDRGGPAIREYLAEVLSSEWEPVERIVADDQPLIEEILVELATTEGCCLVVTTGGTGPALRDVTPEATEAVCQ